MAPPAGEWRVIARTVFAIQDETRNCKNGRLYTHTQALRGAPELARRWTSGEIFRFGPRASGLADADNRAPPYDFLKPKCIRMIVNYAGRCAARNNFIIFVISMKFI